MPKPLTAGLLGALRFDAPSLPNWPSEAWMDALRLADKAQLTLPLAEKWADALPPPVAERLRRGLANTAIRQRWVREAYQEISGRLDAEGLPFLVLKGFAGDGLFFPCAYQRAQYDIDLLLNRDAARRARDLLIELDYHPLGNLEHLPTDHLPVMVRKTGWEWRGDFFDPEIPVSVDLHFRLWDAATERFAAPGWEHFFCRRTTRNWDGLEFPALVESDALAYHCLHLLRHLLRGSLRLGHAQELSYFLHQNAEADELWAQFEAGDAALRQHQAVCFALTQRWFGPNLSTSAQAAVDHLPAPIHDWIRRYGDSPWKAMERPNKDELWLHLSLIDDWPGRCTVLKRRLLPSGIPQFHDTAYLQEGTITAKQRWQSRARRAGFILSRVWTHTRVLPGVLAHGVRWAWTQSEAGALPSGYWQFLGAAGLFNLGSFIFLVLYNLYLADLGYREDVIGRVASSMTVGSLIGSVPAAMLLRRWGVRVALVVSFTGLAIASASRVFVTTPQALVVFAFTAGLAFALYAVAVAPTIAQLAGERLRARAFSIFFAVGIALGIVGGQLAGHLPALLGSKQTALLVACALVGLGALPPLRLSLQQPPISASRKAYPRGAFLRRFLPTVLIWSAAAGAFTPFFNVFFAQRMHASVAQVGNIYSLGQVAQVIAILGAPYLVRRRGARAGVAVSQLLCGVALAGLAVSMQIGLALAALFYAAYLGFHFMGEPGLFSLMMGQATPEQHGGASALNFLATFAGQAIAVAAAGLVAARYGYTPVMLAAALLSWLAAFVVWRLPRADSR